jgi:hypothetical protein
LKARYFKDSGLFILSSGEYRRRLLPVLRREKTLRISHLVEKQSTGSLGLGCKQRSAEPGGRGQCCRACPAAAGK